MGHEGGECEKLREADLENWSLCGWGGGKSGECEVDTAQRERRCHVGLRRATDIDRDHVSARIKRRHFQMETTSAAPHCAALADVDWFPHCGIGLSRHTVIGPLYGAILLIYKR